MQDGSSGTVIPKWVTERFKRIEDGKSDRAVVKSEFRRVDGKIEDLKGRLNKGHHCTRDGDIREMQGSITANRENIEGSEEKIEQAQRDRVAESKRMYAWYIRGLAALILFLVTSGGAFVWYLAGIAFHLEAQGERLTEVEQGVPAAESVTPASVEQLMEDVANRAAIKTLERFEETGNLP